MVPFITRFFQSFAGFSFAEPYLLLFVFLTAAVLCVATALFGLVFVGK